MPESYRTTFDGWVDQLAAFLGTPLGVSLLAAAMLVYTLAWCRLFAKAGFKGHIGVYMLVPGLNVVLFLALAFFPWPVRREARDLRRMQKAVHRADKRHQKRSGQAA